MTRIVAGTAGGRRLAVPPKCTRPTAERVREALFSAVEAAMDLSGARVLDLYAGSGALGLEALSRGAAVATFFESDRSVARWLGKLTAYVVHQLQYVWTKEGRAEVASVRDFTA